MLTALEGVRVLECAMIHAGPGAGEMLAELGAEVIKIEDKTVGDRARTMRQVLGRSVVSEATGRNLYFEGLNFNKKSIAVDLKTPEGRDIVYRLVEKSDVFLTNYRRSALQGLGLDYDMLRRHNPKLIYTIVSGYGPKGPDHALPATDWVAQARSGIMKNQKEPDCVPTSVISLADQMGAIAASFATLVALLVRERCGEGQEVDVSLLGSMIWLQSGTVFLRLLTGHELPPVTRHQMPNPLFNVYKCKDAEWLCLHIGTRVERFWPKLCRALGDKELSRDPRFQSPEGREANNKELIAILDKIFSKRPRAEWLDLLKKEEVIYAPVNSISDLSSDPQVVENGYIIDYNHPTLGEIKVMRLPFQFSLTPLKVVSPAPEHGEHTHEVLSEIAGYSSDEIANFRNQGII